MLAHHGQKYDVQYIEVEINKSKSKQKNQSRKEKIEVEMKKSKSKYYKNRIRNIINIEVEI